MLRRLALAIGLITGTAQAGEFGEANACLGEGVAEETGDDDGIATRAFVRPDGRLALPVAWDLVRLVLPDLDPDVHDAVWIETPPMGPRDGALSLGTLGGTVVADPDGAAVGVVRRALVGMRAGTVLALELEQVPADRSESVRVVIAWSELDARGGTLRLTEPLDRLGRR